MNLPSCAHFVKRRRASKAHTERIEACDLFARIAYMLVLAAMNYLFIITIIFDAIIIMNQRPSMSKSISRQSFPSVFSLFYLHLCMVLSVHVPWSLFYQYRMEKAN